MVPEWSSRRSLEMQIQCLQTRARIRRHRAEIWQNAGQGWTNPAEFDRCWSSDEPYNHTRTQCALLFASDDCVTSPGFSATPRLYFSTSPFTPTHGPWAHHIIDDVMWLRDLHPQRLAELPHRNGIADETLNDDNALPNESLITWANFSSTWPSQWRTLLTGAAQRHTTATLTNTPLITFPLPQMWPR